MRTAVSVLACFPLYGQLPVWTLFALPWLKIHDLIFLQRQNNVLAADLVLCGRFKVLSCLGEGGMGQVYEALDLELGESIAIKAIKAEIAGSPGTIARFKREVYATRKITHPNVCRTFDLECHTPPGARAGEPRDSILFLTMELLHGETLGQRLQRSGPLPSDQVYVLAVQVAGALAAAHEAGIIHCDLKPANIFLTGSESKLRAVVTDFGIARVNPLYDQTSVSGSHEAATRPGEIIGTPDYMAPEQFRTRECTPATDLYSFGLILYEALTGVRGFADSPSEQTVWNKLASASEAAAGQRPAIPKEWSYLLSRCLQIDPANRFSHVDEVMDVLAAMPAPHGRIATSGSRRALRTPATATLPSSRSTVRSWLERNRRLALAAASVLVLAAGILGYGKLRSSARTAAAVPSVAVLPIASSGNDPQAAALAENMVEDLTNDLSQVSGIRIPSEAVVRTLGNPSDVRTAGRQLKVDAVVSGSLMKAGDGMRLVMNLVDAQSGAQIWGQSYDCKPADCASLDSDIAQEVAFRLQLKVDGSNPRTIRQHSRIPAAEAAYQKGEQALAEHTGDGFARAVDSFQQAIDADPQDAPAMAELAHSYALMAYNYNRPEAPLALLNQAEQTARRALQLDSTSAEAYSSLAEVEVLKDFNWIAAEKDFKRAIELDPSYLPAHVSYALHLLTPLGRFAEARAQYGYANRMAQSNLSAEMSMAITDFYARQNAASIQRLEAIEKSAPGNSAFSEGLADNYVAMGEPEKALPVLMSFNPDSTDVQSVRDALLGIVYAKMGRKADALRQLDKVETAERFHLNYPLATLLAAVGYNDKAVDYLERSAANRETDILFMAVDPMLDPLRSNPRFHALEVRLNLITDTENTQ